MIPAVYNNTDGVIRCRGRKYGEAANACTHAHFHTPSRLPTPTCGEPVLGDGLCVLPTSARIDGRCPNVRNHRAEKRCEALRLGSVCRGALRSDGVCTAATEHDPLPVPVPVFELTPGETIAWWIKVLDHHGVPRDAGAPLCARILRQRGYKIDTNVLGDVVRERRHPW